MAGTIVCGVKDSEEGRAALAMAVELSERLDLRLVLAHVAEGIAPESMGGAADGGESLTMKNNRQGAVRLLARLAGEYGVATSADRREAVGDPASLLGQIAAEEAADLILLGARPRGRLRRGLESKLAEEIGGATDLPVLIAPPRRRRAGEAISLAAAAR
jgi:nucleotide-binding universal stress UspA family protein